MRQDIQRNKQRNSPVHIGSSLAQVCPQLSRVRNSFHFDPAVIGTAFCKQGYIVIPSSTKIASLVSSHHRCLDALFNNVKENRLGQFSLLKSIGVDRGYIGSPSGGEKPNIVPLVKGCGGIVLTGTEIEVDLTKRLITFFRGNQSDVQKLTVKANEKGQRFIFQERAFSVELRQETLIICAADDKRSWTTGITNNLFPREVQDFAECNQLLLNSHLPLIKDVINALGSHLHSTRFVRLVIGARGEHIGPHTLRSYQYPALPWLVKKTSSCEIVRVGPHSDFSLFTVLPYANEPGLQVLKQDGIWSPVNYPEGATVVMAGQLLNYLTRGLTNSDGESLEIPAPLHRVVSEFTSVKKHRYSTPIFVNPDLTQTIPSLKNGLPLRIQDRSLNVDVTLNPGLKLLYSHLRSSTQFSGVSFSDFERDYKGISEKIRTKLLDPNLNAIYFS